MKIIMKKNIKKLKFYFKFKSRKGISLLLVLLISGVMLTTTLIASDVMLRVGRVIRSISASQKTYFSAEGGVETILYEINKNYTAIASLPSSGTVGGITWNLENTIVDEADPCIPDSSCIGTGLSITPSNPIEVGLKPSESFQLNLDIEGGTYPAKLTFSRLAGSGGQVIVFQEDKTGVGLIQYSGTTFPTTTPNTGDLDTANYRYKIRILNDSVANSDFEVRPSTNSLPVGVAVTISADNGMTKRIVTATSTRWQVYGQ